MKVVFRIVDPATRTELGHTFETVKDEKGVTYSATGVIAKSPHGIVVKVTRLKPGGGVEGTFALKILGKINDNRRDRFLNEIDILSGLEHPHILRLVSKGFIQVQHLPIPWMIMELGGFNLDIYINGKETEQNFISGHGPFDPASVKKLGVQMCETLKYIHSKNILHRDIKPQNFVLSKFESDENISMIDFGIAKPFGKDVSGRPMDRLTLDDERVGPMLFFSPELVEYAADKSYPVDYRSDMWQLARVIWFMATGKISTGRPSRKADPTGGTLHSMVDIMSNDDPDERLQSIDEMIDLLNKI